MWRCLALYHIHDRIRYINALDCLVMSSIWLLSFFFGLNVAFSILRIRSIIELKKLSIYGLEIKLMVELQLNRDHKSHRLMVGSTNSISFLKHRIPLTCVS